ncbi:hypothetical protein AGLY_008861 [Aphis glycines]|uniref:Uncharacterized protein n=1 Tax=Aphis glycines TaxID=307491 RepID=A0A6G0TL55_APHGL|nr:hypothetical protein AGLY_008861 [Aphis glycines]
MIHTAPNVQQSGTQIKSRLGNIRLVYHRQFPTGQLHVQCASIAFPRYMSHYMPITSFWNIGIRLCASDDDLPSYSNTTIYEILEHAKSPIHIVQYVLCKEFGVLTPEAAYNNLVSICVLVGKNQFIISRLFLSNKKINRDFGWSGVVEEMLFKSEQLKLYKCDCLCEYLPISDLVEVVWCGKRYDVMGMTLWIIFSSKILQFSSLLKNSTISSIRVENLIQDSPYSLAYNNYKRI